MAKICEILKTRDPKEVLRIIHYASDIKWNKLSEEQKKKLILSAEDIVTLKESYYTAN